MARVVIAFLVAALMVPVLVGASALQDEAPFDFLVIVLTVTAAISFGGTVVFGVPAYLFLCARKWTALWIAPLVGLGIAIITWYVFFLLSGRASGSPKSLMRRCGRLARWEPL